MSRLSTAPGLAALRETLGIDPKFSTCLALTSDGPNRTNLCLGKLGDKRRKAVQGALEQLSERIASGSTLSDVNDLMDILSVKLLCKKRHFPLSDISQHEWNGQKWRAQKTYIRSIIKGCLEQYLDEYTGQPEADTSAPASDNEDASSASSIPNRTSVVPERPRICREDEMVDHVSREATPTRPESPHFDSSFDEDIDASFASASSSASEDSLFSLDDRSGPSIYSRETTPFEISQCEVPPSEVSEEKTTSHDISTRPERPSVIIQSPTQSRRRHREDEKQQTHLVEPDASQLEDERLVELVKDNRPPSSIDAIGKWNKRQGPKKGPKDGQPGEADSNHETLSSPAQSGLLAPKASLTTRRRSVSQLADVRPPSTADPERENIRTVDDENGRSRYKGYTVDQVVKIVSPKGKTPSKDCIKSVAYAREMDSDIRHCLGGKMHYCLSSTRARKEAPVCDILATMREPIHLDYDGGWIYVFSIKAAPGLVKIGLSYEDMKMEETQKLWDHTTKWGSILPGPLLLNGGASVPSPVVARLKEIQSKCELGDFTLEYFVRVHKGVHKAESLIHKTLHKHAQYVSCLCGTQHREWFYIGLDRALSVVNIWHEFMSSSPYGKHGFIREFWQSRCAGKAVKGHRTTTIEEWFEKSFQIDLRKEASENAKRNEKALQEEKERLRLEEEVRLLGEENRRLEEENRRREAALRKEEERREEERKKKKEEEELQKLKFGRAIRHAFTLKRVGTL